MMGSGKLFAAAALLILGVAAASAAFYPFQQVVREVKVLKVTDGDTLKVNLSGEKTIVRLKHVDTPETYSYNTPEEFETVESWRCLENHGFKAKEFAQNFTTRKVNLSYKKSVLGKKRGSYGRLLGEIRVGNQKLGERLVEKGLARSYTDEYLELEKEARKAGRGLWSCG